MISIEPEFSKQTVLAIRNEAWDDEYLKYRADLNFEVGFEVNYAIVTKWDFILFGKLIILIYNIIILLNMDNLPLR